ncbi:hypothetical protein EDB87DRAFT_1767918 [Lactarius vividus]|nr:hypothetical protein EDB87DRAFT_1767918 [Lactarius vividus]
MYTMYRKKYEHLKTIGPQSWDSEELGELSEIGANYNPCCLAIDSTLTCCRERLDNAGIVRSAIGTGRAGYVRTGTLPHSIRNRPRTTLGSQKRQKNTFGLGVEVTGIVEWNEKLDGLGYLHNRCYQSKDSNRQTRQSTQPVTLLLAIAIMSTKATSSPSLLVNLLGTGTEAENLSMDQDTPETALVNASTKPTISDGSR